MIPRISALSYPMMTQPLPEDQSEKQEYVRSLFDGIAHRYDFLNHFLSCGFDILWRKRSIRLLREYKPKTILDLATGTGDLAIEAVRVLKASVTGIDISEEMLTFGTKKIHRLGLDGQVTLERGSAEALRFDAGSFDAVTVAFGVRNFANVERGLLEMYRVLRPHGVALVLEFSKPTLFPFNVIYGFYFQRILPFLGGLISRNRDSYQYLPNSVRTFPSGKEFLNILQAAGFSRTVSIPLTLGIATIYLGVKEPR